MAFVNLLKHEPLPRNVVWTSTPGFTTHALDASGESVIVVFEVPKDGTLDKFEFLLGTVTQAPANGLKCSFQDVSVAATPATADGTPDQYRVVTSGLTTNTWVAPGLMTSDGTDTGVKRTVTKGQLLALKVEFESFSASDSLQIRFLNNANAAQSLTEGLFPYNLANGAVMHGRMIVVLKYNDGTYWNVGGDFFPYSAINSHSVASNTTPDEVGNAITFPTGQLASGVWFTVTPTGNFDLVVYDDASNVLATISHNLNLKVAAFTAAGVGRRFTTNLELAAGSLYRVAIKPSTTTALTAYSGDVAAAAIMNAMDLGEDCYWTQRTDGGSWTDTTTRRAMCGFIIAGGEEAGGGGVQQARSMTGGMSA